MFVRAPCPATGSARASQVEARLRRGARGRDPRAEPRAHRAARRRIPGAPWQVLPYERQLAEKEQQVRDALTRIGGFEDPPVEPIVPAVEQWRYRNKLEYSFGDGRGRRARARLPPLPAAGTRSTTSTTDILASERIDARARAVQGVVPRAGAERLRPPRRNGGFLRNLVVREGRRSGAAAGAARHQRRATSTRRASRPPSTPTACSGRSVEGVGETTREGKTELLAGEASIERGARADLRFRISPEAFFQTNTEMAERLYGDRRRARRRYRPRAGLRPLLRHRHDRAGAGRRAGEVWGVEIVEEAVADAITNAELNGVDNAQLLRRRRAHGACGRWSRRPASPTWSSSTRRAPACRRRSCAAILEVEPAADRLRLVQPDDARAERAPARRGRLQAEARAAGRHVPADAPHRGGGAARERASLSRGFSRAASPASRRAAARPPEPTRPRRDSVPHAVAVVLLRGLGLLARRRLLAALDVRRRRRSGRTRLRAPTSSSSWIRRTGIGWVMLRSIKVA